MSWQLGFLRLLLKHVGKPMLRREPDPVALRRRFQRIAVLAFREPPLALYQRDRLVSGPVQVPALWARGPGSDAGAGVLLWLHGGAYVAGGPRTHRAMALRLAHMAGMAACLPDYRLAPEHPFPAAFDDACAAYAGLIARGYPASRIVLGGDSAGGGLALALLAHVCRENLPRPAGLVAFSPLTDMTFGGESFQHNAATDVMLPSDRADDMRQFYLAGADPADWRASPLFAAFADAPPVLIQAAETELLRDDALRMVAHLRSRGCSATADIRGDLPHVWQIFQGWLPEADVALEAAAAFMRSLCPPRRPDGN